MPQILATIMIGLFLAGCGKHYWQAERRGVVEFQADSGLCIQEAKSKYDVSESIYRGCMRAHGWRRVQAQYPTDLQFRGPEDEDEFLSPPDPLSARGPTQPQGAPSDGSQSRVEVPVTQNDCLPAKGLRWVNGRCYR
jgi:hypothetical protein